MTYPSRTLQTTLCLAALAASLVSGTARAADAGPALAGKNSAVSLAPGAQPGVKRITLSAKAAERLDVQTGKVSEDVVIRKQVVSGMVIYPQAGGSQPAPAPAGGGGFGGFTPTAATTTAAPAMAKAALVEPAAASVARGESWVVVNLSPGEYARINKDKPAHITPLYTRDKGVAPMEARLSDAAPVEDSKRSMLALHYVLPDASHGLPASTRVRVELQLAGSEDKQKVVPYNALYYDSKGQPWVYVNPQPLTYERQRVTVQRVVGKQAVISDGPPLGTAVVTVGAALLYGTEIFGK